MKTNHKLVLAALLGVSGACLADAELSVDIHRIQVEVMNTPQAREKGLMFRKAMPENHGMAFVFTKADRHCMWMANTLIPLSVAFLDEKGTIVNIEDMVPQTRDIHCAAAPATFALEMNAGWFRSRGISPGRNIQGMDKLPPGE